MGLDMYLYLRKHEYVSNWSKDAQERKKGFYPPELDEIAEKAFENNCMARTFEYEVAYWRKANEVHNYFVERCAGGVDDCQPVWVSKETLKELVAVCREIIAEPEKAKESLPTQAGFFFGSTEYDEYYMRDLEYTVEILEPVIKFLEKDDNNSKYDIIYRASW